MTSTEAPASPSPKCPATGWQRTIVSLLGIALWIMLGAYVTLVLKKPKQDLRITNTGSQSVDIRGVSAPWWDDKVLTLHPGMSGFWMFRDGDQFRITRSTEATPKPGMTPSAAPLPSRAESWGSSLTPNPDGSATIAIKHASRTAEVRVNEAGKIEFEFTDL
jgi:hypothetical protein